MKIAQLKTNGDPSKAVAGFLKSLVEKGILEEVMAPAKQPGGGASLAIFSDLGSFDDVVPWAPVMPVQGARMVSKLAFNDPGVKVGVVLRPCEARAAVELIKLKQIRQDNLTFITVDCPGTCELKAFDAAKLDVAAEANRMVTETGSGEAKAPASAPLRTSCSMCVNISAKWGEIRVKTYGENVASELTLECDDKLCQLIEKAEIATFAEGKADKGDKLVKDIEAARAKTKDAFLAELTGGDKSLDALKKRFSTCIRCYNCMESCPICYCKQCIFKSTTFEHPSERFAKWALRKGVQKMPSETMLFHLTRLNHMVSSCISCGLCDTACPMGLPVATLFNKVGKSVQKMLEYNPGRSLEDPIPLSVFREDELQAESGAKD